MEQIYGKKYYDEEEIKRLQQASYERCLRHVADRVLYYERVASQNDFGDGVRYGMRQLKNDLRVDKWKLEDGEVL